MKRIDTLDYLRGLAACGIMVYHFLSWSGFEFDAEDFFGRLGLYGVAIFYVLSGITLYKVYANRLLPEKASVFSFYIKRFFRIFPLLWLITLGTIIISKKYYSPETIAINVTGIFGFIAPHRGIGNGVWSIGNELVFYALFPLLLFAFKYKKALFYLLAFIISGLGIWFAFVTLKPTLSLADQWPLYVNSFNQAILFLIGFCLPILTEKFSLLIKPTTTWILFSLAIFAFTFFPVMGDRIALVTGLSRIVFIFLSALICFTFYTSLVRIPQVLHRPLKFLGEASYSIYLSHGIVFSVVSGLIYKFALVPWYIIAVVALVINLMVSYVVYHYYEIYFIRQGNVIVSRFTIPKSNEKPTLL